jgi:hypothetical protein
MVRVALMPSVLAHHQGVNFVSFGQLAQQSTLVHCLAHNDRVAISLLDWCPSVSLPTAIFKVMLNVPGQTGAGANRE